MATLERRGEPSGSQWRAETALRDGPFLRFGWRLPTAAVRAAVERHGRLAHSGNPYEAAEAWIEAGFEAQEVSEWLKARCFDPSDARELADAGVTPEDLARERRRVRGVSAFPA